MKQQSIKLNDCAQFFFLYSSDVKVLLMWLHGIFPSMKHRFIALFTSYHQSRAKYIRIYYNSEVKVKTVSLQGKLIKVKLAIQTQVIFLSQAVNIYF